MSDIKYVCFDIGGVANVQTSSYIILSAAQKKWDISEDDWKKMVQPTIDGKDIWRQFQNGNINAKEYISAVFSKVKIPPTSENKRFFCSLLEDWCGVPYLPILGLVEVLNKNGYHTSVLSNNNEIMYYTPGAEVKNSVKVAISSHEIGVSKPQRDAYSILLDKIGANIPTEVMMIDDKKENIEAAISYGLQGFHFRSKEIRMDEAFAELVQYLRCKGVRV